MCVPRRPPSIGFVAQPTNRSPLNFEAQTKKPSRWFWGTNHQTRAASFEAQTGKPSTTLVLSLNQETRAPSLNVPGADHTRCHPTSRPPSHRVLDLCDHPQSSAPGLLLLSWSSSLHAMQQLPHAHHGTSKCDSPNETKVKEKTKQNYTEFKFKPRQVNDSSQSNQVTVHLVSQRWNQSTTSRISATTISSSWLLILSRWSITCWKTYISLKRLWLVSVWTTRRLMCVKKIACCSEMRTRMTPNVCIVVGLDTWRWEIKMVFLLPQKWGPNIFVTYLSR
jgi:hypothetical protein